MDAAYSRSMQVKMRKTHHVQSGTKNPLETLPILLCQSLKIVPPILSIEQEKTETREMKISTLAYTFFTVHYNSFKINCTLLL